jgi:hypothetical protein
VSGRGGTHADFRAGEQNFAYRRGFVLGLTLAEAALLLVFVILLLLAVGFDRRDREIRRLGSSLEAVRSAVPAGTDVETFLAEELARLAELRSAAEAAGLAWDDSFVELVKATVAAQQGDGLMDATKKLAEERAKLERLQQLLTEQGAGADLERLAQVNVDQAATIDNQRGQLRELLDRLQREGKGGVLPSCWTTPDGKIEFVLDVVLGGQGIRARDTTVERRQAERTRLPWPDIKPEQIYSEQAFLVATQALFDWSVKNECRFYVVIYDATGNDQKALYKDLLQAVEGHFYKRLSRDAATF